MKILHGIALATFLFAAAGCSKKSKDTIQPAIVGYWDGKYGMGNAVPTGLIALLFRKDGTVRAYYDYASANRTDTAQGDKAEGTYFVTGTTVKASYRFLQGGDGTSILGTLNTAFTAIDGTYGSGTNTSNGGSFRIFKK